MRYYTISFDGYAYEGSIRKKRWKIVPVTENQINAETTYWIGAPPTFQPNKDIIIVIDGKNQKVRPVQGMFLEEVLNESF